MDPRAMAVGNPVEIHVVRHTYILTRCRPNSKGHVFLDPVRILTWNLNHKGQSHRLHPHLAESLLEAEPDVIVLTEYREGIDHTRFAQESVK